MSGRTIASPRSISFRPRVGWLEDRLAPATLTVDDGVHHHGAEYTSIQAAVNAAHPGDTIRVYPGTYNESVTVNKTLTLDGAFAGREAEARSGNAPNPNVDSIVQPPIAGATGFTLAANNITLDGFTVRGAKQNAGIYTDPHFSGYQVLDNEVRDNTIGLYLHSSGTRVTVAEGNAFITNNVPGSASGNAIYSDQGLVNARIVDNYSLDNQNAGILLTTGPTTGPNSDVVIEKNESIQDDAGIFLINTTDSVVSDNTVVKPNFEGIRLDGGDQGVKVLGNQVRDGGGIGILVWDDTAPNKNITVAGNRVTGFAEDGIALVDTTGQVVANNVTRHNARDGISLVGATNNSIIGNRSTANGEDGIRASSDSTGNVIAYNVLRHNAVYDAEDLSTGTGTAGTANTWYHNKGKTENRPGLLDHTSQGDHGDHDGGDHDGGDHGD